MQDFFRKGVRKVHIQKKFLNYIGTAQQPPDVYMTVHTFFLLDSEIISNVHTPSITMFRLSTRVFQILLVKRSVRERRGGNNSSLKIEKSYKYMGIFRNLNLALLFKLKRIFLLLF